MFQNRKVVPSYLGTRPMGMTSGPSTHADTNQLLLGEIKEIIEPTDKRSLSKLYKEYNVDVQFREGTGPTTVVTFPNCLISNLFGGVADKFVYTLRADGKEPTDKKVVTTGSKVLLLCLAGSAGQAIIIGGIRESQKEDDKADEKGHNLSFSFNGILFDINDDGELKLQLTGATKVDGEPDSDKGADPEKITTTVEILKNGNFKLYTKEEKQFIHVDHENKKCEFLFDEEWNVKVNKKVVEEYGDAWSVTCKSTIAIESSKDATQKITGGTWTLDASGKTFIKSAGLEIGKATDNMLLATTYRKAETQLHSQLMGALTGLATQLGVAGAAINAACQPMKIPVAGPIIASAILQPAGVALTGAVSLVTQMVSAITSFEGQAATYLSMVNKND
jgi:hypothetical protein